MIVPDQWKLARITPIPKLYQPVNIESDLRSIAVTNLLAKSAEKFVSRHFNEYFVLSLPMTISLVVFVIAQLHMLS